MKKKGLLRRGQTCVDENGKESGWLARSTNKKQRKWRRKQGTLDMLCGINHRQLFDHVSRAKDQKFARARVGGAQTDDYRL